MSQAGLLDIESTHPQIPTLFVADIGSAIPIGNELDILGGEGIDTSGAGKTITISAELATSGPNVGATNLGICSFNDSDFSVVNGFVSISSAFGGIQEILPDIGTIPVVPNITGQVSFIGGNNITTSGGLNSVTFDLTGSTNHAIQVGNATGSLSSLPLMLNGQLLIGKTSFDPAIGYLSSIGGTVIITNGAGTINLEAGGGVPTTFVTDAGNAIPVANILNVLGGNNIITSGVGNNLTVDLNGTANHAVQIGNAGGSLSSIGVGVDGSVLLGATGADPSFALLTSIDGTVTFTPGVNTLDLSALGANTNQNQIYYVGKHGNDANSGLNIEKAKLTFGAAITAASALTPSAINRFVIECFDDGIYTENITCAQYVDIHSPNATLVGNISAIDDSNVKFGYQSVATANTGVAKFGGAGTFKIDIDEITCAGTADWIVSTSGVVMAQWKKLTVVNGHGIGDLTSALAHIHVKGGDIYINGTGVGVARANAGSTVGHIDHIIDIGGGNGVGLAINTGTLDLIIQSCSSLNNAIFINGGTANLSIQNINSTSAYDVQGGVLNLIVNSLTGSENFAAGIRNLWRQDGSSYQTGDASFISRTAAQTRNLNVQNTDNTAASYSSAAFNSIVGGATTIGDPYTNYLVSGAETYSVGIDNSDSDKFKITNGANPSTGTDLFAMTSLGVISLANDLDVTEGGTGVSTLTSHGILLGNGAGDIQATAEPSSGQIPIGKTGDFPQLATLTAGSGIGIVNGAGSITISATTGGLIYEEVTTPTKQMVVNYCYGAKNGVGIDFKLPLTATKGDVIEIVGITGIWKILQNANQQIFYGTDSTSVGIPYGLTSEDEGDTITLRCIDTDLVWRATCGWGNFNNYDATIYFSIVAGGFDDAFGLTTSNISKSWGQNNNGTLGDNSTTYASIPITIVGNHTFTQLSMGLNTSYGLKSNGQVWAWGEGREGALGNLTITDKSSPILIVGSHSFTNIGKQTGSSWWMGALKASGEAWMWGNNVSGNLGNQTTTSTSSPVLVVGSHSFTQLSTGHYNTLALKSNTGNCWSWGEGTDGVIGNQTVGSYSSPILVVGSHSFTSISSGWTSNYGLKTTGQVWAWGNNTYGQLGDYTATNKSSPILVTGAHSFVQITAGYYTNYGLKINGEVWAWGRNNVGQLGNNSTTDSSSPILVTGAHSFVFISSHGSSCYALKSDNRLWSWGDGTAGQLGDGTNTSKSSPVLVTGY